MGVVIWTWFVFTSSGTPSVESLRYPALCRPPTLQIHTPKVLHAFCWFSFGLRCTLYSQPGKTFLFFKPELLFPSIPQFSRASLCIWYISELPRLASTPSFSVFLTWLWNLWRTELYLLPSMTDTCHVRPGHTAALKLWVKRNSLEILQPSSGAKLCAMWPSISPQSELQIPFLKALRKMAMSHYTEMGASLVYRNGAKWPLHGWPWVPSTEGPPNGHYRANTKWSLRVSTEWPL